MNVKILLERKREGDELAEDDIRALVSAYARGDVGDAQMSAFAMAVCCNGMTAAETAALTDAMRKSGVELEWSALETGGIPTADKHSTGGVGDKISLVALPLAASCGVAVPSLAGRGLGLTGGTIDKLETIPGFTTSLSPSAFQAAVAKAGVAIAAQTPDLCPADRKLYALRDVTGTVASIPLITSSILSKKLAEGAGTLVFDVKCGSGAFMKTRESARELAVSLVDGARRAGRKACALVTDMSAPLGYAVGNRLEVDEAVRAMLPKGGGNCCCHESYPEDIAFLSVELAARMVSLARSIGLDEARDMCRANLEGGAALKSFECMVRNQGGRLAERPERGGIVSGRAVKAGCDGFVSAIDAGAVAVAALMLGAGRSKPDDSIDPDAGVVLSVKRGDMVAAGQYTATVLSSTAEPAALAEAAAIVSSAIEISPSRPKPSEIILEAIE